MSSKRQRRRRKQQRQDQPEPVNGDSGVATEYPVLNPAGLDRMERLAIREKWPVVEPKVKEAAINRQARIAVDPASPHREATSAFNALLSVTKINNDGLTDSHGRPTVAIQQNFGGGSSAIERKRTAEADLVEMRRAQMAGEMVRMEDVITCFETFSRHVKQALEQVQRISPESARIIEDGIDRADRELGPLLAK